MRISKKVNSLIMLVAAATWLCSTPAKASVTINYEVGEITDGGNLVLSGTLFFISHGVNNLFDSNVFTSGTSSFLGNDDKLFAAVSIVDGAAYGALSDILVPTGTINTTTKFTGLFVAGLTSSDVDYSTGSLLSSKTFGTSGTSYNWGSYRTDNIEAFGGTTDGNIAWVFPAEGSANGLFAYANTGETYIGATYTANLATSSSFQIIPEPSTGALMLIGAAGLVALRRLRKV
jgi:hypothetical protein